MFQIWKLGSGVSGGQLEAGPSPSDEARRGTKALACVYPQVSVHQINCGGLIVNQLQA